MNDLTAPLAVAGAGLSGAVIARELALAGYSVHVFEQRPHVAGNCHTKRDPATGIMEHCLGPHIFHTDRPEVWSYVQQFSTFQPFVNRVKAIAGHRVYTLPINLLTINQFFQKTFSPEAARHFIAAQALPRNNEPRSFEEQALQWIGAPLYEAFFKGYTQKQWGVDPAQLPASILQRLPVRFNYDDNYFTHPYQGMPTHGYTALVERILQHPQIHVHLNQTFQRPQQNAFRHVFYSGSLDAWFAHQAGHLRYRTLDFHREVHQGDFQGNAVINYCDADVPWTRISEHKHFSPWETHTATVIYREYSRAAAPGDVPFYPLHLLEDKSLLHTYVQLADQEKNITFIGRLGTYRYLDMDKCIAEALQTAKICRAALQADQPLPLWSAPPL